MAEILVLDDMEDLVGWLQVVLRAQGHNVHGFTEEKQAIDFAGTHRIDLAILDIKLKKMSGTEVLGELKKIHPRLGVLMLTGYPSLETAQESVRLGAYEYCVKPIELDELEEKVAAILKAVSEAA